MKLKITGTTIKSWFQYRCPRKVVYEAMPYQAREAIPILEGQQAGAWANFGRNFEAEITRHLQKRLDKQVLAPLAGETVLSDRATLAFLKRTNPATVALQAKLGETPALRNYLALPDEAEIGQGRPDVLLVTERDGIPYFRVIDIKGTQRATAFHKAQVAFYALMLKAMLQHNDLPGEVDPEGEIWLVPEASTQTTEPWTREVFHLKGYVEMVTDFFHRTLPPFLKYRVDPQVDETFFHLYYKCEQCKFLDHCRKSIDPPLEPGHWDVSAVPGLSHSSKRALVKAGIRTVRELAAAKGLPKVPPVEAWGIRSRAREIVARAGALMTQAVEPIPDRYSLLIPPRADVAIHLLVDRNPADGYLLALGCHLERPDQAPETLVRLIDDPAKEREALLDVLGRVVSTLAEVDQHNQMAGDEGWIAHLYTYEPAEASDLQLAIGRHLSDVAVRAALLELIRIFPPEEAIPDPTYRSYHNLPAAALRQVVDQLYILPAKVSLDLKQVSQAFDQLPERPEVIYRPAPEFWQPFSSRLSIDRGQEMRMGEADFPAIEEDARQRLMALCALRAWLEEQNRSASVKFLRLHKRPFRFGDPFDPLGGEDLEILRAFQLLESRAGMLATLTELARPAEQRRERLRCLANLTIVDAVDLGHKGMVFTFSVPEESRQSDLGPSTFAAILHDDSPDVRLTPSRWPEFQVKIESLDHHGRLTVRVAKHLAKLPAFKALLDSRMAGKLYLDEVYIDINTPRIESFLRHLARRSP